MQLMGEAGALQLEIWDWQFDKVSAIGSGEAWEVLSFGSHPRHSPFDEVMERVCVASREVVGLALVRYRVEKCPPSLE
jgi:hypothetical protein